jgi:hypothetical protein
LAGEALWELFLGFCIHFVRCSFREVNMRLLILILLILLVVGALPTWPYSAGWGYYPSSGLGTVLIVLLVLVVLGVI